MPAHTFQISVKNTLTLKKPPKTNPYPLLWSLLTMKVKFWVIWVMPNISRATALIQQSHFKGTLGKSVTDYALDDQASPAISIVGVGKLISLLIISLKLPWQLMM